MSRGASGAAIRERRRQGSTEPRGRRKEELDAYLHRIEEEAEKRETQDRGRALDLHLRRTARAWCSGSEGGRSGSRREKDMRRIYQDNG